MVSFNALQMLVISTVFSLFAGKLTIYILRVDRFMRGQGSQPSVQHQFSSKDNHSSLNYDSPSAFLLIIGCQEMHEAAHNRMFKNETAAEQNF